MKVEAERAVFGEVDIKNGKHVVFAPGLRNPVSTDHGTGARTAATK